jgi:hypothetical protein
MSAFRRGQDCPSPGIAGAGHLFRLAHSQQRSKRWEGGWETSPTLAGARSAPHPANDLAIRNRLSLSRGSNSDRYAAEAERGACAFAQKRSPGFAPRGVLLSMPQSSFGASGSRGVLAGRRSSFC